MAMRARIPISLAQIHRVVGGELVGSPQATITNLASFEEAGPNELAFVTGDRMLKTSGPTRAGILLAHRRLAEIPNPHIIVVNPKLAFAQVAQAFFCPVTPPRGIDATVVRGIDTQVGPDVSIWPGVTLGARVMIGARVTLYPGVFIGDDTTIGDDTLLYPNVVVREGCTVGARVIIHSGTVIGSDGFGYEQDQGRHYKIPQLGGVTIEDDVEIGANSAVDRPAVGETRIGAGTKVDNLVQIGHGVKVGRRVLFAAQVGIAGSCAIDDDVVLAGQVGVANHVHLGKGVIATAQTGIPNSVDAGAYISGYPAIPHRDWLKSAAIYRQLPSLRQRIATLEQRIVELEEKLAECRTRPDR